MNHREYFVLGCKILGIYCLVISLTYIVSALQIFILPAVFPTESVPMNKIMGWTYVLTPILLIGFGMYLIKDGQMIHNLAYRKKAEFKMDSPQANFLLLLKMLGMYLIIDSVPTFLKVVSNILVYANVPRYYETTRQKEFIYLNILPSTGALILGFYLLISGQIFLKMALKSDAANPTSDNDSVSAQS